MSRSTPQTAFELREAADLAAENLGHNLGLWSDVKGTNFHTFSSKCLNCGEEALVDTTDWVIDGFATQKRCGRMKSQAEEEISG